MFKSITYIVVINQERLISAVPHLYLDKYLSFNLAH